MAEQPTFEPVVRGASSYVSDGSKHSRNWKSLSRFLEGGFVGAAQLLDGSVDSSALADGAVHDAAVADVSISKLTDGTLTAIGTMVGAWVADHLRFDGTTGLTLVNDDGSVLVRFPADGSEPFYRGQVEATGLLVENDFVLRGENNLIEAGAAIVMGGAATGQSVGDPAAAPGLAVQWETWEFDDTPLGLLCRGLFYDSTNTSWWLADASENKGLAPAVGEYDNDASHTLIRAFRVTGFDRCYGVVRIGTRIYVLGRRKSDSKTVLRTFSESTLAFLGERPVFSSVNIHGVPGLGTDGTNAIVVALAANGTFVFHAFTAGDVPVFSSTTTSSGTGNPDYVATGATQVTGFVLQGTDWWVSVMATDRSDGFFGVHKFNSSGVYQQNNDFENGENIRGVAHDGTNFVTLGDEHVVEHTNWTWTTESGKYHVAYTYVDDNGSASVGARPLGAGDFETRKSPTASIVMKRRARLRCSAAAVDTTLTGVTHIGWYIERGSTEPTLDYQADSVASNGVQTVRVVEDFTTDASPEAPPGTNTFPDAGAGNYATFESSGGEPILRANGYSRTRLRYTAAGSVPDATPRFVRFGTEDVDTDSYHPSTTDALAAATDSSYEITYPFDGQYLVIAYTEWPSNSTGRRRIRLFTNGSETDRSNMVPVTGEATRHTASWMVDVQAGDLLTFEVFHSGGVALNLTTAKLAIVYLGPA